MTTQTPERLITRTMRGIGFLGRYATPKANEIEDVFDTLQDMVASWNLEPLMLPYTLVQPLPLVANQSLYSIGPTGTDLVLANRPERLKDVNSRQGTAPTYIEKPCRLYENYRQWMDIVSKGTTANRASQLWYNPKSPNGELNVYPVPSESGMLILYIQDKFVAFPDLTTEIILPNGLIRALKYNLGMEIAPELGINQLPQGWEQKAIESKASIKSRNIEHGTLELETPGVGAYYNVQSDSYQ